MSFLWLAIDLCASLKIVDTLVRKSVEGPSSGMFGADMRDLLVAVGDLMDCLAIVEFRVDNLPGMLCGGQYNPDV